MTKAADVRKSLFQTEGFRGIIAHDGEGRQQVAGS